MLDAEVLKELSLICSEKIEVLAIAWKMK